MARPAHSKYGERHAPVHMADAARQPARKPAKRRRDRRLRGLSRIPLAIVTAISIASAAIMLLGSPLLWSSTEVQAVSYLQNGRTDILGEYTTVSQSTDANRASNLAEAASALDGTVIMPGAELSMNETLGDTENDEAYLEAPAFDDGSVVYERGGGICQVSSALYVAAIQADLDIVERHPHTMACDYVPLGLDATISYGEKDLVIRNSSDTAVRVRAEAKGQTVKVSISGTPRNDGATFEAISKMTNVYSIPAEDAPDDLSAVEWSDDETATYYIVESYKVKYVNGVAKDTTFLGANAYLVPNEETGELQQ